MNEKLTQILDRLPEIEKSVRSLKEVILANLVLIGEVPAPTFNEAERIAFLSDRFLECGVKNISGDEIGNAYGQASGTDGERTIAVVAHADTFFDETVNHAFSLGPDWISGPGVGENSLGLAALASVPNILDALKYEFKSDLLLIGATRSLGRGDLAGIRFFLDNNNLKLDAGLCIEGVKLGRLNYQSLGMLRGEITCTMPEEYDWNRFGASSAILIMNDVINRIMAIPRPQKPRTTIVLGSIEGGTSYHTVATSATLRFEIRSESSEVVATMRREFEDIVTELSGKTRSKLELDIFASREPGGIAFEHPLVRCSRSIMEALEITPRFGPSMSELAAFISHNIPAVTLGITSGENMNKPGERIQLEPIFKGITQMVALLIAMDEGCIYED